MLTRYRDALVASTIIPTGSSGDRMLMFPPEFNQAMRELDRCLQLMRQRGDQEAINGTPLKTIRWHTIAWHVDAHHRQTVVYKRELTRNRGKGPKTVWTLKPDGYRLETIRNRDARQPLADLGVTWLANHYAWDRIHLKAIREACGELERAA